MERARTKSGRQWNQRKEVLFSVQSCDVIPTNYYEDCTYYNDIIPQSGTVVLYSNYYHRQCNECSVPETAEMVVRACICTSPPLVSQSIPESPEHTTAGITVAAVFVILFKFEIEQEYHHGIGN